MRTVCAEDRYDTDILDDRHGHGQSHTEVIHPNSGLILTSFDTIRSLRIPLVPASFRYGELPEYTRAAKSCSKILKQ